MLRMLKTICNFWSLSSWSLGHLATLRIIERCCSVLASYTGADTISHIPYVLNIVSNPDDHTVRTTICTLYYFKIE